MLSKIKAAIAADGRIKSAALVLAVVLLIAASVGGTVAYMSAKTDKVDNSFVPGVVSCRINETAVPGVSKTSVTVTNTGNTDAYIRVAVVGNTVNDAGEITGNASVSFTPGSGWTKNGDYYYYDSPVAPGASTGELLGSAISLDHVQVTVLAQAIQTVADASTDAWGWTPPSA